MEAVDVNGEEEVEIPFNGKDGWVLVGYAWMDPEHQAPHMPVFLDKRTGRRVSMALFDYERGKECKRVFRPSKW